MKKFYCLLLFASTNVVYAETKDPELFLVDGVFANVGSERILFSDVQALEFQLKYQNQNLSKEKIEKHLFQNAAVISKAKENPVPSDNNTLHGMVEERINLILEQFNNNKTLIKSYLGKGIYAIKKDLKKQLRDQYLREKMQMSFIEDVRCTYKEVSLFFEKLKTEGRLPVIEEKIEAYELVLTPDEDSNVLNTILEIRKKIDEGEDFVSLVKKYSQDEETVNNDGELGWVKLGELRDEYEMAALKLKPGEVSKIVKTELGYHIIQLIDSKEGEYNSRHIFLFSRFNEDASLLIDKAKTMREKILQCPKRDRWEMVKKNNFRKIKELNADEQKIIKNLNPGDVSEPFDCLEGIQNTVKIIFLQKRTPQHVMNMKDDYEEIFYMTKNDKTKKILNKKIKEIVDNTVIIVNKK